MQNTIMINGVELTTAQIMTIHVALQGFATHLTYQEFPLGDDEHGKIMTRNYLANIYSYWEIQAIIDNLNYSLHHLSNQMSLG